MHGDTAILQIPESVQSVEAIPSARSVTTGQKKLLRS
jgi:hypothetical protein